MCFHKNYIINFDKAYTGNDELVYNIFVYNISRKDTQEEILEYFSKFGEVVKVHLVDKSGTSDTNVCFVNFSNPIAAAKALSNYCSNVCDNWKQPKLQHTEQLHDEYDDTLPTLLQLDDDCLEYILKLLQPRDQLQLARACQRLRNVWQIVYKLQFKEFCSNDLKGMTFWEVRDFFELAGPNMETIELCKTSEAGDTLARNLMLITSFCPNLKSIRCERVCSIYMYGDSFWLAKFVKHVSQSLIKLELIQWQLQDDDILAIAKLNNLKSLALENSCELTGKHLDKLINIKHLNLSGCTGISPCYFIKMCQSLTELKSLNIKYCYKLTHTEVEKIATHCHNLENLQMSMADECVARLPKLKSLQIRCNPVLKRVIVALAKHAQQLEDLQIVNTNWLNYEIVVLIASLTKLRVVHCSDNRLLDDECLRKLSELKNLEELDIRFCKRITNEGLLFLIKKCTKLRFVNVQHCKNITDAFVAKAITLLHQPQEQQKEPLLMDVNGSGIRETIFDLCINTNLKISLGPFRYPNDSTDDESSDAPEPFYYDI